MHVAARKLTRFFIPSRYALLHIATSKWRSFAIEAVARMDIADLLPDAGLHISELARLAKVNEDSLYRVMRALAREGLFKEKPERHFFLNRLSRKLRKTEADSVKYLVTMMGASHHRIAFANIELAVRTGCSALEQLEGQNANLWTYFQSKERDASEFNKAMQEFTIECARYVACSRYLHSIEQIADIGCGSGVLLAEILRVHRNMTGVAFDLPAALTETHEVLSSLEGRGQIIAGDMWEDLPAGLGGYLFKNIFHNLDDESMISLLVICKKKMKSTGMLFVIEHIIPERSGNYFQYSDMTVMVTTGGKERTAREFQNLLARAGFKLVDIENNPSLLSLIVAKVC